MPLILARYQIALIIIGICILIGLGFTLGNPSAPAPIFSETDTTVDMIEKNPSETPPKENPTTLTDIGTICTKDPTVKRNGKVLPNISTDLGQAFTSVESFGIAGKDMMEAWSAYAESIADTTQKLEVGIQASQVGGVVVMANLSTTMAILANMYSCSIIPEGGVPTCDDTALSILGVDAQTTLEPQGKYTRRVVMRDDKKNTVYTIRGTIGDPGNITIDMESTEGKSSIITTRDSSGTETSSIISANSSITVTENNDCSGKFVLSGVVKSDISADMTMTWQLMGEKTTGTLVSKSNDSMFNTSYSW